MVKIVNGAALLPTSRRDIPSRIYSIFFSNILIIFYLYLSQAICTNLMIDVLSRLLAFQHIIHAIFIVAAKSYVGKGVGQKFICEPPPRLRTPIFRKLYACCLCRK